MHEHPGGRAVHAYLPQLVDLVDEEVRLRAPCERLAAHLDELRPLLEPMSLDLDDPWEPIGVALRVGNELPHG